MNKFVIDIDLIFNAFSGRGLLLLNEKGVIIKANNDAAGLTGEKEAKSIIGATWDDKFGKLSKEDFTFANLINTTTNFLYFELSAKTSDRPDLIKVKIDPFEFSGNKSQAGIYYFITLIKQQAGDWEDMLYQVMKGTERSFGKDYLQSVTKTLAKTLQVDFAFIGQLAEGKDQINVISFWEKDKYKKPYRYALAGSPCEDVVDKKKTLVPRDVVKQYPKDVCLAQMGVESYFGVPIYYNDGKPLGLLVVMDSKPMLENPAFAYILNIFANRVGAEIEWMETQRTLKKKDRKLRSVIDSIPHPIFYKDKQGRYEGVNKAFLEATQLSEEDIIGKKSIHLDNKGRGAPNDEILLSKNTQITYESPYKGSKGTNEHFLMTKSTITDEEGNIEGIAGAALNITNLKLAQNELKINEEKYRTLFSTAHDAILLMNQGIFIDCNEKTLEMFGCSREDIIGHPPYEFSPEHQPDGKPSEVAALARIKEALTGKSQNFYWLHKKKSGAEFDAEVSLNAFKIGDETYIQAIVRDVTDKLQLAKNVEIQKERMEKMYEYISASDISFQDQLANLLELATNSLGMEVGLLSRIEGDDYVIIDYFSKGVQPEKNKVNKRSNTYCDIAFKEDRLISITEMGQSPYQKHPCYSLYHMESYIGVPYWVRGQRYGTLAFMSPKPVNKYRPIDLDFVQMLAQWIGSALERAQFEENLLERDALLETMLREIPIDFSVRDANLNMVIQSDLSKEYWGNNEGKPIDYRDVDEKTARKWRDIFSRVLQGEVVKGEDRVEIYGKPYTFWSIASPVKVKGKVTEVIIINIDISKLKETEQKLKEQNEQLTKLNSELDRFVYSASHDLRAPLASLLGLIDLTSREMNTDSTKQYLELMSKSINTMDRFIADITEYSRNLRLDTVANKIDFEKLFEEAFDHIQYMLPGPATYSIHSKGKVPFYSDYERLKMVINNLVSNSIRYKAYGRDPHIEFRVELAKKMAKVDVIDNGIGIDKKHLDHVFEMFYRANDKNVGSGLGLFIVKETVEKLNGTISISSELNAGTKVHLELPNLEKKAATTG